MQASQWEMSEISNHRNYLEKKESFKTTDISQGALATQQDNSDFTNTQQQQQKQQQHKDVHLQDKKKRLDTLYTGNKNS